MAKQETKLMDEIKSVVTPRDQLPEINQAAGSIFSPNLPVMDSVDSVR